jgi:hypothetical protein
VVGPSTNSNKSKLDTADRSTLAMQAARRQLNNCMKSAEYLVLLKQLLVACFQAITTWLL